MKTGVSAILYFPVHQASSLDAPKCCAIAINTHTENLGVFGGSENFEMGKVRIDPEQRSGLGDVGMQTYILNMSFYLSPRQYHSYS